MEKLKSNGFSLASMICGITSLAFSGVAGLELAIVALVMRSIYRKKTGGQDNSDTQVGYITGLIAIIIYVVQLVLTIVMIVLFMSLTAGVVSWAVIHEFVSSTH